MVGVVLNAMQESHKYHADYYYGYDYGESKEHELARVGESGFLTAEILRAEISV